VQELPSGWSQWNPRAQGDLVGQENDRTGRARGNDQTFDDEVESVSKYRNVKTDGYSSKKEARRAAELQLLEKGKAITDLQEQFTFVLAPAVVLNGRRKPALKYIADFVYFENGKLVVEDVKGIKTPVYRIKQHLMATVHNIQIREI
jgi:hypothetical protein